MSQPKLRTQQLDIDDEEQQPFPLLDIKRKPYQSYEVTYTASHPHYFFCEEVVEPNEYTEVFHRLNTASPSDVIYFHINTIGGNLFTGIQLINAMRNSPAKIVTVLEGMAYSLGTFILLAGDEIVINDNCVMMFHNYSSGVIGKGNEMQSHVESDVKLMGVCMKSIASPFLSKDEITQIMKGQDLYLHTPDIKKRLATMLDRPTEAKPEKKQRIKKTLVEAENENV